MADGKADMKKCPTLHDTEEVQIKANTVLHHCHLLDQQRLIRKPPVFARMGRHGLSHSMGGSINGKLSFLGLQRIQKITTRFQGGKYVFPKMQSMMTTELEVRCKVLFGFRRNTKG